MYHWTQLRWCNHQLFPLYSYTAQYPHHWFHMALLVLLPGSKSLGVSPVPPDTTSTGSMSTSDWKSFVCSVSRNAPHLSIHPSCLPAWSGPKGTIMIWEEKGVIDKSKESRARCHDAFCHYFSRTATLFNPVLSCDSSSSYNFHFLKNVLRHLIKVRFPTETKKSESELFSPRRF